MQEHPFPFGATGATGGLFFVKNGSIGSVTIPHRSFPNSVHVILPLIASNRKVKNLETLLQGSDSRKARASIKSIKAVSHVPLSSIPNVSSMFHHT